MYVLWYDDNPKKTVSTKIDEAVVRFTERYGRQPEVCMLNEIDFAPGEQVSPAHAPKLRVMHTKSVPTNYFWVGCDA
jgi:hypothetical protein